MTAFYQHQRATAQSLGGYPRQRMAQGYQSSKTATSVHQSIYPAVAFSEPDPKNRPLRVIHVGPCMLRGGAETWLMALIRFLDPRRIQLLRAIVTAPELVDPDVVAELPIPCEVGQADSVRRAVGECDILICWGPGELGSWLAGCRPRLCVFVAHGEGAWSQEILHECAPVVDHVVAVSRRVREKVCNGVPCTTIFNGVDTARLARTRSRSQVRQSLGFKAEDFVLGYVGRFSPEKKPQVVIDAVAQLPAHFKALMIGWGPMHDELLERAATLIPGRHVFVSACDYLGDYYQAMDSLCLLSTEEGFALVVLEAMLCERPVIATSVGSVPEVIVDRVNGLIIPGDAASVCDAAELLYRYPAWARGLAAEGRAFAEQHGHASRMARDYQELLEKLWAEKQAQPTTMKSGNDHACIAQAGSRTGKIC